MIESLVRAPGRSVSIRPLAVALTALLAFSTLACGRSGLRGLNGSSPDGGPPITGQAGSGGGGHSGTTGTAGSGGTNGRAGNDGGAGSGPAGSSPDARPDVPGDTSPDGKRVIKLSVSPAVVTLGIGGTINLTATLTYSDGTTSDTTVSAMWSSNDGRVATVMGGHVVAFGVGTAQITAFASGFMATATVQVVQAVTLVSINIDPGMVVLPIGAKQVFTVTGFFSDGTTANVTPMAKWTADTSGVISIDASGIALALKPGSTTLLATVGSLQAKAAIFVSPATVVQISVQPPLGTIGVGTRMQFTADATLSDGTHSDVTSAATWSIDDGMVGTIDRGIATGTAPGKTSVRASFGGATGSATLVVTGATLKTLQIDPVDPVVGVNVQIAFHATGIFSDGTKVDLTTQVMWGSSAPSVLPIDGAGRATSKSVGTSVVTATAAGGVAAKSTVTVTPASLKSIVVTPDSATLSVGGSIQLRATGTFSDGSVVDLTDSVVWTTMPPMGVVSVSNVMGFAGLVKAVAPGVAAVVATSAGISGATKILVTQATVVSIKVSPPGASVQIGATVRLTAQGTFSDGSVLDVTSQVSWGSIDSSIATVANAPGTAGLVTGVKAGTVTITAMLGNAFDKAAITVVAASLKSIEISPANATMTAGLRQSYTATGFFTDGSKADLTAQATWSTGNTMIATVSNVAGASGQLLARAAGTTTVSATLNGVTGQTNVTVTGPAPSSLAIAPIAVSTPLGTAVQFTATLILSNGTTQNVTGPADWISSNPMAATINGTGRATPFAVGTTTITATFMGFSAMTTLTVTDALPVSIEITPISPTMPVGTSAQFTATAILSDGTTRNVTNMATWVSSKPNVVGINTMRQRGRATAVAAGTVVITATYMGLQGETAVTATDSVITEISVSPQGLTMPVGERRQFAATAIRSDGTTMNVTGVATWLSDAPGVAAVSTAGMTRGQVTAISGGTATISVAYMGVTGSVLVTVSPAKLTAVQVTPFSPTMSPNTQLQFVATALFSDGTSMPVTGMATWGSSDGNVAGVSNAGGSRGLATSLMKGSTTISATYMGLAGSTVLQVTDATITQIQVTPFASTIPESFSRQFTATAIYSDGSNRDITSQATWTSSDTAVALVSDALATKGLVVASAGGKATIQAQYGGSVGSTVVVVSSAQLAGITLAPNPGATTVGKIVPFTATGVFDDATTLDVTTFVTWTSSNLDVADVSNADGTRGEATAFGIGTTTVQAQRGAVTATSMLIVK